MARSDKDNPAKEHALRYCVASGMLAYLEVDVFTSVELTAAPKKITDIDVLGIHMRQDGSLSRTLFDCKSAGGPAFARALWLSGLMNYVKANEGVILMGKPAERAHRLAARQLNINVFGAGGFDNYAIATNPEYKLLRSYAAVLENWLRVIDNSYRQPALAGIYAAIHEEVPLAVDPAKALRRLVSRVLTYRGEMNPAKPFHMAAFLELVVAVSFLLNRMVNDLRNIMDLDEDEKNFASVLRYYVWGGPEGLAALRKMRELMGGDDSEADQEVSLLAWPQLLQLVRGLLDAPTMIKNSTFALRELSFRPVAEIAEEADHRIGRLFAAPRARQFAKRIGSYTASIMRLPQEFANQAAEEIDLLVAEAG